MKYHRRSRIFWIRLLLMLSIVAALRFIFSNSMEAAAISGGKSVALTSQLNALAIRWGIEWKIGEWSVRKFAHLAQYALLGFLLALWLRAWTARGVGSLGWPLFFGLIVSVADETLQLSVQGRAGLLSDVWIDFWGVIMGMVVAFVSLWLIGMARRNDKK